MAVVCCDSGNGVAVRLTVGVNRCAILSGGSDLEARNGIHARVCRLWIFGATPTIDPS